MATRRDIHKQKNKVDSIFNLIHDGVEDDLAEEVDNKEVVWLKDYEEEGLEYIRNEGKYQGISTGYKDLDFLLGSFLPGELLVIGGDTGHGKSLLAMNIAQNAYKQTDLPVLLVNLELTRPQAVQRFYNLAGLDHDYQGILIQKAPAVRYSDIDVLMKRAKEEGACLVVIDHLHFFSRSADNEARELSRITKHFKECAVQNNLPVILLSHVTPTRVMDHEGNVKKVYKPGLHNLKGSSAIEQDADMVSFVFRDEQNPTQLEFYMKKNRSRPLNTESAYLIQKEWKLIGEPSWIPEDSEVSGDLSEAGTTLSLLSTKMGQTPLEK